MTRHTLFLLLFAFISSSAQAAGNNWIDAMSFTYGNWPTWNPITKTVKTITCLTSA
jgi:hypothetical protein